LSRHTGYASLPLHGGKAPAWLFGRMVRLSREIVIYLAAEYGTCEVLRRLRPRHPGDAARPGEVFVRARRQGRNAVSRRQDHLRQDD
jgi:hypothetical protein